MDTRLLVLGGVSAAASAVEAAEAAHSFARASKNFRVPLEAYLHYIAGRQFSVCIQRRLRSCSATTPQHTCAQICVPPLGSKAGRCATCKIASSFLAASEN